MLGHFVVAVREPPEIMALLEAPLHGKSTLAMIPRQFRPYALERQNSAVFTHFRAKMNVHVQAIS